MSMQSRVTRNKVGPPLTKRRKEVVGNVVVVFPTPQTVPGKANHVIIVGNPVMYNNIVNSSRRIIKTKKALMTRRPRLFRWWVLMVQFSQFSKVLSKRLGYQWLNVEKDSCST